MLRETGSVLWEGQNEASDANSIPWSRLTVEIIQSIFMLTGPNNPTGILPGRRPLYLPRPNNHRLSHDRTPQMSENALVTEGENQMDDTC